MKPIVTTQTALTAVFGCNKYQLADKMRNNFHIPDEYLGALEVYCIVHCSGKEFADVLFDGVVIWDIKQLRKMYSVIYNNCMPYHAKRAKEIRLSFRAARPDFGIEPVVLVQIVDAGTPE